MLLTAKALELLRGRNFCHVGTIRKDGSVSVVPTWVDTEGEHVLLNSADGRGWVRNLERDPRVTCTISPADNPYEFVQIRGEVVERTHEGADEHIDLLSKKYLGKDKYPYSQPGEVRVIFKILPEDIYERG